MSHTPELKSDFYQRTSFGSPVELNPEEDARLISYGYQPICADAQSKKPAAINWRTGEITVERIRFERASFPHSSTGLRTGALVGVDIDVANEEHWPRVAQLAKEILGDTPLSRRGSKGLLLTYRNLNPIKKITMKCRDNGRSVTLVEVLGDGQQFIAFGLHPKTKQPYQWTRSDNDPDLPEALSPLNVPLDDLPEVTPDKLRQFVREAAALLSSLGYQGVTISGCEDKERRGSKRSGGLVDEARLLDALSWLDAGCAREDYWRIIAGVHAANIRGDNSDDKGGQIVCRWARGELDRFGRYKDGPPGNYVGDDDVLKDYETSPPRRGGITVATVFKMARDEGWRGDPHAVAKNAPACPDNLPATAITGIVNHALAFAFPDIGNNGRLKATTANTRVALEVMRLECSYDVFHDKLIVGGLAVDQWGGPITDELVVRLCRMIHKKFGFEPEPKRMELALQQLCFENKFNPVVEYLDGLVWDGVKRIETWLIEHAGAPDTPFVRAASAIALIAAVRRARHPGCKFDEIIVLEGKEGLNKSSLIELMAGSENFSDQSILGTDDRKQQEQMAGVWLYELADLTGISKAETEKVKAFASRQEDRSRPAYGRFVKHQKRQCILFATTNDKDYLQSQTGNRRWWPVPVTKACNLKTLASERDQLWAEAAHLEAQGASV